MRKNGYLEIDNPNYPSKLLEHLQDPKGIYYEGNMRLLDKPIIGIVGSRKGSSYGALIARELAKLAADYDAVVLSGLARGVDSIAHRGVLEAGGETIAIVANGIDVVYPKENRELYEDIKEKGLIISEYPPGTKPEKYYFPTRNRIISALSDAIVIIEASGRSGSLITAEAAIEQGKEVYAVPGNINSIYSIGTNKLIKDGATPLVFLDDVFRDMGLDKADAKEIAGLGSDEKQIYEIIAKGGEIPIANICNTIQMEMPKINAIITILEMKGLIYSEMGKVMIANFNGGIYNKHL